MEKRTIIAIDFDGTIVADQYPGIGLLKPGACEAIKALHSNAKHYIIINTCRQGSELVDAVNFLIEKGIPFDRVNDNAPWLIKEFGNTRKIHADIFIDSAQVGHLPDWSKIVEIIDDNLPF